VNFAYVLFFTFGAAFIIASGTNLLTLLIVGVVLAIPPAAKVLAIVAVVYPLIQGLKRVPALTPHLSGWVAIALNVLLSGLGVLVTVPAAQLYSTDTLAALVTVSLAAAGVHGTVKGFTNPSPSPASNSAPGSAPPAQ